MRTLYHFFILRNPGVTREALEKVLSEAPDWFRYYDTCYVVDTSQSPQHWRMKLASVVEPKGRLFICKLDETHYYGWMSESFWKWYQAKAPLAG
jgi:hypothetical protein